MSMFYTGATGVGTGPHLDFRVYDVGAETYVDPTAFTDVLRVDGNPLVDQFRMTSGYGPRRAPTIGASTMHRGLDYATPEGTAVEVLGGNLLSTFEDKGGGIMSQYGIMRDGKPYDVLLLHGSRNNPVTADGAVMYGADSIPEVMTAGAANTEARKVSKEKAQNYSSMSKAEINKEYDRLRSTDPAAAKTEGMKMHKAFFK